MVCNHLTVHFASTSIYRSQKALRKLLSNFSSSTEEKFCQPYFIAGERERLHKVKELFGIQTFSIQDEEIEQLSLDSCLGQMQDGHKDCFLHM